MVLVLDPLQEKVSCPLTARSELDSPSSDVFPRYQTHSNSSASARTHGSYNCSRVCASTTSDQVDETPSGSSLSTDPEVDAHEKIEQCATNTTTEDALDGAVYSIQRRRAIRKPSEDVTLKQKVTHGGS